MKKLSQSAKDEEEIATYPSPDDSDAEFGKPVYEFERIKGRITHHFCIPIIKKFAFIDYCSFAKMPGVWFASSKREGVTIPKSNVYNHKQHVVKNCLRQLIRKEYEDFFGKCHYSMTKYENNFRISLPYKKNFLIALNVQSETLNKDFSQLDQNYYCTVVQKMEKLKDLCKKKSQLFVKGKISSTEMLEDFFSTTPKHLPKLREELIKTNFNKKMRYISIGTIDGIPLARFLNTIERPLLDEFDEFEYFIETASAIKMRDHFSSFFGGTKFNLAVYEKIAVLTIPIPDTKFFALITMDNKMKDDKVSEDQNKCDHDFYFPKSLNDIDDFIKNELDVDYLTAHL